ncbi:hypothetical protein CBOM_02453 [Ceraceosorus bombacis]|uniref:Uncharacterized protein n=1 Tax=Ceraceosorus bombacis TaxID=401625 RepID=A0A0P1BFD7_9BASI|nr:hypothetical protein CBOM_02453 [Ceraceosorus bombacis]
MSASASGTCLEWNNALSNKMLRAPWYALRGQPFICKFYSHAPSRTFCLLLQPMTPSSAHFEGLSSRSSARRTKASGQEAQTQAHTRAAASSQSQSQSHLEQQRQEERDWNWRVDLLQKLLSGQVEAASIECEYGKTESQITIRHDAPTLSFSFVFELSALSSSEAAQVYQHHLLLPLLRAAAALESAGSEEESDATNLANALALVSLRATRRNGSRHAHPAKEEEEEEDEKAVATATSPTIASSLGKHSSLKQSSSHQAEDLSPTLDHADADSDGFEVESAKVALRARPTKVKKEELSSSPFSTTGYGAMAMARQEADPDPDPSAGPSIKRSPKSPFAARASRTMVMRKEEKVPLRSSRGKKIDSDGFEEEEEASLPHVQSPEPPDTPAVAVKRNAKLPKSKGDSSSATESEEDGTADLAASSEEVESPTMRKAVHARSHSHSPTDSFEAPSRSPSRSPEDAMMPRPWQKQAAAAGEQSPSKRARVRNDDDEDEDEDAAGTSHGSSMQQNVLITPSSPIPAHRANAKMPHLSHPKEPITAAHAHVSELEQGKKQDTNSSRAHKTRGTAATRGGRGTGYRKAQGGRKKGF